MDSSSDEHGSEIHKTTASEAQGPPARIFTMLENNPNVMNELAHRLGVSSELAFYDLYSIYDEDMLALVPRPAFALLVMIPLTKAWKQDREAEDARLQWYQGAGSKEPAFWLQQTIIHGCGLIGFLHCVCNGVPAEMIAPGSELASFLEEATPLGMETRAQLLKESEIMYEASEAVAIKGDTNPFEVDIPGAGHFVALVKGRDGHLWELEGSRKGPLDRGALGEGKDALSERALQLGLKRLIDIQRDGEGDLRFSCIALALKDSSV
ncbi:hypothetical protein MMC25_002724 [Agyrium rufum]|nr:hypothetical protein [Agyrium rufum]